MGFRLRRQSRARRRHIAELAPTPGGRNHRVSVRAAALDHVQLAMPADREGEAEEFHCGVLGFTVLAKPEPLASRGGRWFASGSVQVHLGVEEDFRPARKARPALRMDGFDDLVAKLEEADASWRWDEDLPGVRRLYVDDPFGSCIEVIDNAG